MPRPMASMETDLPGALQQNGQQENGLKTISDTPVSMSCDFQWLPQLESPTVPQQMVFYVSESPSANLTKILTLPLSERHLKVLCGPRPSVGSFQEAPLRWGLRDSAWYRSTARAVSVAFISQLGSCSLPDTAHPWTRPANVDLPQILKGSQP